MAPKEYFQLQLDFAKRVAEIEHNNLDEVLLNYTSFYKNFEIEGWDFNPKNAVWQSFLKRFKASEDKLSVVYNFYIQQQKTKEPQKSFGCFSFHYDEKENYIQIHFQNNDDSNHGPLNDNRIDTRKEELKNMFREIQEKYPKVDTVAGFSWLYNLESYKRLFPPEYIQNMKVIFGWFKTASLWGQFLDKKSKMREDMVSQFLKCIAHKLDIEELEDCFPLKVLEPETDIKNFYIFYAVEH